MKPAHAGLREGVPGLLDGELEGLGASNISFGLPNRHTLNAAFLPMANSAGLTSAIMNALSPECVTAAHASDLLMGNDPWGANWIAQFRSAAAAAAATA